MFVTCTWTVQLVLELNLISTLNIEYLLHSDFVNVMPLFHMDNCDHVPKHSINPMIINLNIYGNHLCCPAHESLSQSIEFFED